MAQATSITFDLTGAEIPRFPINPVDDTELAWLLSQQGDTVARMLSYLKALPAAPSSISDAVQGNFDYILAGQGGDFLLTVDDTSIFARHKDAAYPGPSAPYTGNVRGGLLITGNGIAMGYNRPADGVFVPAVAITNTGDINILGTLTAGSVIATTVVFGAGGPTASTVVGNAAHGASHATIVNSNPHGTSLAQVAGDLDDIADGSLFFKTTASHVEGAARAVNALDSSYDYIRAISTQKIIVSSANPANGVVFDSAGLRGYAASNLTFNINTSGWAWFGGDISGATGSFAGNLNAATGNFSGSINGATGNFAGNISAASGNFSGSITGATGTFMGDLITSGQIKVTGSTNDPTYGNFSFIAAPVSAGVNGILALAGSAIAIRGVSAADHGIFGNTSSASHSGVLASNAGGGPGLEVTGSRGIKRGKNTVAKLSVWDTATNTFQGEFWYEFHH